MLKKISAIKIGLGVIVMASGIIIGIKLADLLLWVLS